MYAAATSYMYTAQFYYVIYYVIRALQPGKRKVLKQPSGRALLGWVGQHMGAAGTYLLTWDRVSAGQQVPSPTMDP